MSKLTLRALTATAVGAIALTGLGTLPAQASGQSAAPLRGADTATAIDGAYIVVMKDRMNASDRDDVVRSARADGATKVKRYGTALNGFSARMSDSALAELRRNPDVAYVEADQVVTASATQSNPPWGLDRIDQRNLPLSGTFTYTSTGSGVKAYIIDTGVRATHSQFGGRVVAGATAINDGRGSNDCNGHGTHVAGTVGGSTYGVAKSVTIVPVRVLDCNGSGSNSGVIAGVDWVTSNHTAGSPAVANMSLGGGASTALDSAVNNSIADGVTYAVAAGNENQNACNVSPARVANALTIGATTTSDARASYSNFGSCVDLFAPGSGITSSWYTSDTATNTISGTSMATPHVAGAAAQYLQTNPGASPATVGSAIKTSATSGVLTGVGTGSPNLLLYSLR